MYPSDFVDALAEIVRRYAFGDRMSRSEQQIFQQEVWRAYRDTVTPLLVSDDSGSIG